MSKKYFLPFFLHDIVASPSIYPLTELGSIIVITRHLITHTVRHKMTLIEISVTPALSHTKFFCFHCFVRFFSYRRIYILLSVLYQFCDQKK